MTPQTPALPPQSPEDNQLADAIAATAHSEPEAHALGLSLLSGRRAAPQPQAEDEWEVQSVVPSRIAQSDDASLRSLAKLATVPRPLLDLAEKYPTAFKELNKEESARAQQENERAQKTGPSKILPSLPVGWSRVMLGSGAVASLPTINLKFLRERDPQAQLLESK